MKKLVFSLLLLFAFGCTDLDLLPEDGATEFEIFKDPAAYRSYLAKIYGAYSLTGQEGPDGEADISIVNDEGFTSYIRVYWKAQELTTDEAVIAWADAGIQDLHLHNWSSENQFVRVLYYRIALIVSIANDFIRQAGPDRLTQNGITTADQEIIKRYTAEARFLRAMAYWHALDLFGEVPLVTSITSELPEKSTRQELFEFIEAELLAIEADMAAPRANEYGRADQAALWMLLSKLYLNAEVYTGAARYDDCLTQVNKVLSAGYSLNSEYQTLYMTDNHTSNEIIFALNSDGKNTQNWGNTTFLVHGAVGGTMEPLDYGITGGWAGLRTTSKFVSLFSDISGNTDQRAIFYTDGQSLEIDELIVFEDGYAIPKYVNVSSNGAPGSDVTHVDTDYPMFRLADAYLMFAEATLRGATGGNMGQSVDYINELQERAYGNSNNNITMADLDLPFILDERARELYWEATRRIDLIRFNEYTENGIWPWKGNVKEGRTTESFRDIFPIPASELLANPNIRQNSGY